MYKLLLAIVLLNVGYFVEAAPVDDTSSVYNTIKLHSGKCPYLQVTVLKTEPDFLKPCTNFSRISSIVSVSDGNINDVRCAIYYNYVILLCAMANLTSEEIIHYFTKETIEASLKINTVAVACKMLKSEDRKIETVEKSMNIIMPLLQSNDLCHKICVDFTNNLYPACNEAAYMIEVMHNASAQNHSKSSGTSANAALASKTDESLGKQAETFLRAHPGQVQQDHAKIKQAPQNVTLTQNITSKTLSNDNNPGIQIAPEQIPRQPTILKNDNQMQGNSVLTKTEEIRMKSEVTQETKPAISSPSHTVISSSTKLGEDELKKQAESLLDKQGEVKTVPENKPVKSEKNEITPKNNEVTPEKNEISPEKNEITPEKNEITPEKIEIAPEKIEITPEKIEITHEKIEITPEKNEITPEKNEITPEKNEITPEKNKITLEKNEPSVPAQNEPLTPEKNKPVISEKDEPVATAPEIDLDTIIDGGGEDDGARREDYTDSEEEPIKQEEDVKQPEVEEQPEANKQSESKHKALKTPKPEETVDDDILLSASYNQHMDEDDSYFFSYFMMVCVVFILAYVAYHNKQKVFALVLEGRRGRRSSRSRRPNSANYHKLDSNLEEAVSSSCNKNTTHIIY